MTERYESVQPGRLHDRDGGYHWMAVQAKAFIDAGGTPGGLVAAMRVVDAEVTAERELERLTHFDTLTGVLNRTEALTRLETAMKQPRHPGGQNGVLFRDVDRFKDINEAATIAEKIRAVGTDPIPLGDDRGEAHTSLSIGVALAQSGEATDVFVDRVDTAMYAAKKGGRNRVTLIQ